MDIIFATNNAHKLTEVQAVLGPGYKLLTPRDCGVTEEIPEEQDTLEGNASQKAHYLHERTGMDCFADDTGLEVEALGGAPGVHSARYATDGHDFAANNRLLLKNLKGQANRRARFRTVISLLLDGEEHLFEGIVEGRIIDRETGHEGFGFDPLFIPDGYDRTFAQMTTGEKTKCRTVLVPYANSPRTCIPSRNKRLYEKQAAPRQCPNKFGIAPGLHRL